MFLPFDFASRRPKAQTSCSYINQQPIYNKTAVVLTILCPPFIMVYNKTGCPPLKKKFHLFVGTILLNVFAFI